MKNKKPKTFDGVGFLVHFVFGGIFGGVIGLYFCARTNSGEKPLLYCAIGALIFGLVAGFGKDYFWKSFRGDD